jgi:hypothetical protein
MILRSEKRLLTPHAFNMYFPDGASGEKGKNNIEYNMYNRYYPVRLVTMATL